MKTTITHCDKRGVEIPAHASQLEITAHGDVRLVVERIDLSGVRTAICEVPSDANPGSPWRKPGALSDAVLFQVPNPADALARRDDDLGATLRRHDAASLGPLPRVRQPGSLAGFTAVPASPYRRPPSPLWSPGPTRDRSAGRSVVRVPEAAGRSGRLATVCIDLKSKGADRPSRRPTLVPGTHRQGSRPDRWLRVGKSCW